MTRIYLTKAAALGYAPNTLAECGFECFHDETVANVARKGINCRDQAHFVAGLHHDARVEYHAFPFNYRGPFLPVQSWL